ncbi:MAG: xanthine dehydrogenase family protein molybdopterin-binding subunit [Betaproteobacteria bacterium]|nr:xanthine dehydrogenase family protein molybdopterin-binding subunit [Betaproteobacteria bacterium]
MTHEVLNRRVFLKTAGSLMVTFALLPDRVSVAADTPAASKSVATDAVEGFIQIHPDNSVTIYSGKVDLGTGVRTAITQIAAEELDIPLAQVTIVQGDTLTTPDQGLTWGSLSIQVGGMQIRQACATARAALISRAASKFSAPAQAIKTHEGRCWHEGASTSYAELIEAEGLVLKVDPKAPTKAPADYQVVGKSVARLDIPAKVTGQFEYMHDFRLPGMVHARVVRPTGVHAELLSVDDQAARKVPGFVATVREGNFLAVVARTEWGAIQASAAIKPVWSAWQGLPEQNRLWDYVRNTAISKSEDLQNAGDPATVLQQSAKKLRATYDFAIHTHGSLGPSCAVAEWKDGMVTCWTASQQVHLLRKQMAQMMKVPESQVRCIYIAGSGCYGRNGHEDAAADAVLIAKVVNQPVRVQWMRADEHGWDPKGPPFLLDFRGALDDQGHIAAWESQAYIPKRPAQASVTLLAADLALMPHEVAHPGNVHQGLAIPYQVPNLKTTAHYLSHTPFRASWIRAPGRMQNTFGSESFMDELAHAASADPMEFRLRHLIDPRGRECLERVAQLAHWQPRTGKAADSGDVVRGRGVSYIKYELVRTYVAVVADVEVNRRTGKIRVTHFYIAHDCGQIINPDGLKNQLEGNIIQTVSRTLLEEIKFNRSQVTTLDWVSYPILTFPEVPQVTMDLIDRPTEKPWGAGEPAASVVPSAIANGVYDALGVRLRSVPFTPHKVLEAMRTRT